MISRIRYIVDATRYIRNADMYRDLRISTVKEEIKRFAGKHKARLNLNENY